MSSRLSLSAFGEGLRSFSSRISVSLHEFIKDDCFSKASSLTFYTLLSIVPVLAVAFGIAKGFGFESYLRTVIETRIEQGVIANQLIAFAYIALEESHGGVIATFGLLFLLWTVIQLLNKIESALNEIWDVKSQRSYGRQFSDYLAIIILCPIFFVLSSSLSIYGITLLRDLNEGNVLIKAVSPYLLNFLRLVPFLLNWILFSFLYIVLPNTSIQWRWCVFGGVIAGTLYQIVNWIYIKFQIGVAGYSAIYGSFAALPLFLVWINISWQIVLLGAEMACHFDISKQDPFGTIVKVTKKKIAMAICTYCCSLFLQGKKAPLMAQISHEVGASLRVTREITEELFDANILAKNQESAYLPARNPNDIDMKYLFDLFEENARYVVVIRPHEKYFDTILTKFNQSIADSDNNLSLADLAIGSKNFSDKNT